MGAYSGPSSGSMALWSCRLTNSGHGNASSADMFIVRWSRWSAGPATVRRDDDAKRRPSRSLYCDEFELSERFLFAGEGSRRWLAGRPAGGGGGQGGRKEMMMPASAPRRWESWR